MRTRSTPSLAGSLVLGLLVASLPAAAAPFTVRFVIDLREEIAAKRFAPAKDAVGVRGGVDPLSWEQTLPARDEDGAGRYEVEVSFPERPFGGQPVTYKYKVDFPRDPGAGWEDGTNRRVFLHDAAQVVERRYNAPAPPIEPVLTGTLRRHPGFSSRFLGPRDLIVYLPPGYDEETSRRYPVLYMQDGQHLFDGSGIGMEWQMDEIAERLIAAGQIEPVIIVGIHNTEARMDEYAPTVIERRHPDGSVQKAGGKAGL